MRNRKGKSMKKNVLISFVTEAETDLEAVFALNKILYKLTDEDLIKFDVFDVVPCDLENLCNCEMVCYCEKAVQNV